MLLKKAYTCSASLENSARVPMQTDPDLNITRPPPLGEKKRTFEIRYLAPTTTEAAIAKTLPLPSNDPDPKGVIARTLPMPSTDPDPKGVLPRPLPSGGASPA